MRFEQGRYTLLRSSHTCCFSAHRRASSSIHESFAAGIGREVSVRLDKRTGGKQRDLPMIFKNLEVGMNASQMVCHPHEQKISLA